MINTYEFVSNEQGYWGSDSLFGYTQGTVQAITYDCNGEIHEFLENYFPAFELHLFLTSISVRILCPGMIVITGFSIVQTITGHFNLQEKCFQKVLRFIHGISEMAPSVTASRQPIFLNPPAFYFILFA